MQEASQPDPPTLTGFLATSKQQEAAYGFLTATSVAFAVVALALPGPLLQLVFGPAAAVAVNTTFTRIAGATMLLSTATEYSLKEAASHGRMTSATYQRLMVAAALKSVGYLVAFAQASSIWNPVLWALYPTAAAASVVINAAAFRAADADGRAAGQLLSAARPKSLVAWVYALFVVLYLATAGACYAPEVMFTGNLDSVATLLKHTWAPGFLLAAVVSYVQWDAANRGRLGASTFKNLNLGLAGLELTYAAVFGTAILTGGAVQDAGVLGNLGASIGIGLFCLYQYFTAKK